MISLFWPEDTMTYEDVCTIPEPSFFRDLNLDQYAAEWAESYDDRELIPYFYCEAKSYDVAKYRQEVIRDLSDPEISEIIDDFVSKIGEAVRCRQCADNVLEALQKYKWNTDCILQYYQAMEDLCVAFNRVPPKSRAFYALHQELFRLLNTSAVRRLRVTAKTIHDEFEKMRFHISINKDKATFDLSYNPADYCAPLRLALANTIAEDEVFVPFRDHPFPAMDVSPLESFILKQLEKENRQVFLQLTSFGERCGNVLSQDVLDLLREIRFFRDNLNFLNKMKDEGLPIVMPLLVKDKELYLDNCYDIVLALRNTKAKREVILNDIMKANFEKAIIVTGPNQGGKTTLARAFGQCFYFGMMGLPVPAGVCKLPYITNIFTHFANEEGADGVDGRLANEITRIRDMLSQVDHRSIVILNELFTSAPTIDALAMSRDLLKRLLANNAICFYVTHTYEIALDSEDYVSLVATVVEDGTCRRTYRIVRKRADGVAYANSIVSKYKLDYSHINYRLHRK